MFPSKPRHKIRTPSQPKGNPWRSARGRRERRGRRAPTARSACLTAPRLRVHIQNRHVLLFLPHLEGGGPLVRSRRLRKVMGSTSPGLRDRHPRPSRPISHSVTSATVPLDKACRAGVTILFKATTQRRRSCNKPLGVIEETQRRIYPKTHRH